MIPRFSSFQAIAALAALSLATSAHFSGAREPAELARYRDKFEAELTQRLEPAKEAYTRKLRDLELRRALGEDYDGALRAKSKRLAVAGVTHSAGDTSATDGITLSLAKGRRNGSSIHYDTKRSALTGFYVPGQFITWDIMNVNPGIYRVLFTYGCGEANEEAQGGGGEKEKTGPTTGGSFTFEEDTNLGTGEDRLLRHTVYPTGGWDKVVTRNIGRLRITGTTATLKLTALKPLPGGLMMVRSIRLVPYVEQDSLGGSHPSNPLTKVQRRYSEKVAELVGDAFEKYIADLKALEERRAVADRIREALAVKTERTKFERQAKNPVQATREITSPR